MKNFELILLTLLRTGIFAGIGLLLGGLLGNHLLGVILVLVIVIFWSIFSGKWLLEKIRQDQIPGDSLLPLTIEDRKLSEKFKRISNTRQISETQLEKLQGTLRAASDSLPHGVIVINADSEILWVNKKASELIGVRDPEDIGQRIESLIHHLHFVSLLSGSENGEFDEKFIEIDGPHNKKSRIRLSFTSFADNRRMIAVEDITNFGRVDQMRQDFIGNASHELRTPLTVIRGYLEEMLEDVKIPDYWSKPMHAMDNQVLRMQNIIEDMLTLSNIESRLSLAGQDRVHLKSLIENISHDLLQAFHGSHNIIQNIPDKVFIKGEEVELYSIFSNLIKNAFLYSPMNSNVKIEWLMDSIGNRVVVSDHGPGIPEESIQRLTERFYRVDMGRSRERGGTGLGLAIVKHALMRHEAFLEINSTLGEGSRFNCHFPQHRIVLNNN